MTKYSGQIILDNKLSDDEYDFYTKWTLTRKIMSNDLTNGCYFIYEEMLKDLPEEFGAIFKNITAILPYRLPDGHPSIWCQLVIGDDRKTISQKVVNSFDDAYVFSKWVAYIAEHFFSKVPMAKKMYSKEFGFLNGNQLNGEFFAEGRFNDRFKVNVVNSRVYLSKILTTPGIDLSGGYDWGIAEEISYSPSDREQKILECLSLEKGINQISKISKINKIIKL